MHNLCVHPVVGPWEPVCLWCAARVLVWPVLRVPASSQPSPSVNPPSAPLGSAPLPVPRPPLLFTLNPVLPGALLQSYDKDPIVVSEALSSLNLGLPFLHLLPHSSSASFQLLYPSGCP